MKQAKGFKRCDKNAPPLAKIDIPSGMSVYQELLVRAYGAEAYQMAVPIVTAEEDFDRRKAAHQAREGFREFLDGLKGFPAFKFLGSGRDVAVDPEAQQVVDELALIAVAHGIANVNGSASTGYMGVANRAWDKAHQACRITDKMMAPIVHIPLRVTGEVNYEERYSVWQLESPSHMQFATRTPAIYGAGASLLIVFCAGGFGTAEERGVLRLAKQAPLDTETCYNDMDSVEQPREIIIDQRRKNGSGWFHDFQILEFASMLEAGTINRENTEGVTIIRVGEPEEDALWQQAELANMHIQYFPTPADAADFMMAEALEVYQALAKKFGCVDDEQTCVIPMKQIAGG